MSVNEKRITVFLKDGSQEKIVIESGTEKLKERERLNKMTEEEIDQAARSDPDALPVEDEEIWKQGGWVGPEPLPELVRTCWKSKGEAFGQEIYGFSDGLYPNASPLQDSAIID